jgi:flagellar FliJ protein
MKRYHFRLATVLRLRHMEEEQAREALAAANRRLTDLVRARDLEIARYEALRGRELATTFDGLRTEQQQAELAAAVVASARRAVGLAATDAALAQIAWTSARRRVRVLERLDDKRRSEHAEAELHAEVAEMDDLVTARFVRDAAPDAAPKRGGR